MATAGTRRDHRVGTGETGSAGGTGAGSCSGAAMDESWCVWHACSTRDGMISAAKGASTWSTIRLLRRRRPVRVPPDHCCVRHRFAAAHRMVAGVAPRSRIHAGMHRVPSRVHAWVARIGVRMLRVLMRQASRLMHWHHWLLLVRIHGLHVR